MIHHDSMGKFDGFGLTGEQAELVNSITDRCLETIGKIICGLRATTLEIQ